MAFGRKPTTDDAKKEKLSSGSKVRSTKETFKKAEDKQKEKISTTEKFVEKSKPKIVNVYSADFGEIDRTIEEIKKESRKEGVSEYACNNIYNILQEALKKVRLAQS